MRLAAGEVVADRYRLIGRLGAGGMAEVWCAEDEMLDRRVALKFLHERFTQDAQFVERFRREASAAAGLQHANLVGVFDRGEHEGVPYMAMEYVEGASLKDLIARGLSVPEAIEITRQVLAGVRFAHAKGIIHRDLKPQNVLIDAEGRARITDFGIARAGASEITQTGSVLGTAQYLPPEQAQGLPVTAASDVYSVGVMLYETLTGRVPFEADSAVAVALKQVSERPRPPSQLNPAVSPALDAVVLRALAKDPANRFASAEEFIRALDAAEANPYAAVGDTATFAPVAGAGAAVAAGTEPTPVAPIPTSPPVPPEEPPPPSRRRLFTRRRVILLALLLLALGAVAAYALTRADTASVPGVIGQPVAHARTTISHAGFDVAVKRVPSDKPTGEVVKEDPPAGSVVDTGSAVTLIVSAGPGRVKVPDVSGLPEAQASKELRHRGLRPETSEQHSNTVSRGVVISTQPPAGMAIPAGRHVQLLVSSGPKLVAVPSLVGEQEALALGQLQRLGLISNTQTQNADQPEGQVINQTPSAGTSVRKRATVTIVVSTGAGSVVVPNVKGQPRDVARSTLRSQGLKVSAEPQTTSQQNEDGRVLDQAPEPGSRVHKGQTVTIFVGQFQRQQTTTQTTTGTQTTTTTTTTGGP